MLRCSVMSDSLRPYGWKPARLLCSRGSSSKTTGVRCHFLLQGIFLTQELNRHLSCLPHWQDDSLPLAPPGKLVFVYPGQLSCYFLHIWLFPGPFPRCVRKVLLRWIPLQRTVGACSHFLWRGTHGFPSLFGPKEPSCTCADREVFLDLKSEHLTALL